MGLLLIMKREISLVSEFLLSMSNKKCGPNYESSVLKVRVIFSSFSASFFILSPFSLFPSYYLPFVQSFSCCSSLTLYLLPVYMPVPTIAFLLSLSFSSAFSFLREPCRSSG
jgi:hypothetical protein